MWVFLTQKVESVLNLLENGQWHHVEELAPKSGLDDQKLGLVLNFLVNYGFIVMDESGRKAKASDPYLNFIKRISLVERDVAWKSRTRKPMHS